jgi:hypothetical protein
VTFQFITDSTLCVCRNSLLLLLLQPRLTGKTRSQRDPSGGPTVTRWALHPTSGTVPGLCVRRLRPSTGNMATGRKWVRNIIHYCVCLKSVLLFVLSILCATLQHNPHFSRSTIMFRLSVNLISKTSLPVYSNDINSMAKCPISGQPTFYSRITPCNKHDKHIYIQKALPRLVCNSFRNTIRSQHCRYIT